MKNLDISFFRFVTVHAFDRLTDGRTAISPSFPLLFTGVRGMTHG